MKRAARHSLVALLALTACAREAEPGSERPFRVEWPGGAPRIVGTERSHEGRWLRSGPVTFHDERGRLTHRGHYAAGLESGLWEEFYEDEGTGRGPYLEGRRHGLWRYFHPNGEPAQEGRYERGERVGTWKRLSRTGEPREDLVYE